jgi:hypothetical protein
LKPSALLLCALQLLGQAGFVHCHQHQLLLQLRQLLQGGCRPLLLLLLLVAVCGCTSSRMVTRPCCRPTAQDD